MTKNFIQILVLKIEICSILENGKEERMWQLLSYFNFAFADAEKGQNAFLFTLPGFIYYPVGLADYRDK